MIQKDKKQFTNQIPTFSAIAMVYLAVITLDHISGVPVMLATVLKKGAIFSLVAVSMNLLNGFTGLFSLGQAGFMLVGAYAYAALNISSAAKQTVYQYYEPLLHFSITEALQGILGLSFGAFAGISLSLLIAGLCAGILAYFIGLPVLKLRSDYLAIATLGFAEIVRALVQLEALAPITNGSQLLRGFPYFNSITVPFLIVGICIFLIVLLVHSTYGRAFKAIRDDEIAAEAMGINLAKHKQMAFVISSFFAGVSGALLAMYQTSVQANTFKSALTYEILLIVVIGGIGSISGSCIGSFLFVACSEWWLRFLDTEAVVTPTEKTIFVLAAIAAIAALASFICRKHRSMPRRKKYITYGTALLTASGIIAYLLYDLSTSPTTLPLMRAGFRMVVFSIVIMVIVLFFPQGIMGTREFSLAKSVYFLKTIPGRLKRRKKGGNQ